VASEHQRPCKFVAEPAAGVHQQSCSGFRALFPIWTAGPVRSRRSILSKLRLAAGILAVVATLVAGVAVAYASQQERKEGQPPRAEYTVASTAAESGAVATPRIAVPMLRRRGLGPLPDTLTLVVVGGLLLGLAAAVRKTT
jgi:hypothetical protein